MIPHARRGAKRASVPEGGEWGRGLTNSKSSVGRVDVSGPPWSFLHIPLRGRLHWRLPRAPALEPSQAGDSEAGCEALVVAERRTGPADGSKDIDLGSLSTPDLARVALWSHLASALCLNNVNPMPEVLVLPFELLSSPIFG